MARTKPRVVPIIEVDLTNVVPSDDAAMVTRIVANVDLDMTADERRAATMLVIEPREWFAGNGIYRTYDDAARVAEALQAKHPQEVIVAASFRDMDDEIAAVWNRFQAWKADHAPASETDA